MIERFLDDVAHQTKCQTILVMRWKKLSLIELILNFF